MIANVKKRDKITIMESTRSIYTNNPNNNDGKELVDNSSDFIKGYKAYNYMNAIFNCQYM